MTIREITESWSRSYKRSINCKNPRGFSQRAHCAGRKKHNESVVEGEGFDQEAGIGIDGKSFKFKIRDLVALADKYPVTKIDSKQFTKQIAGRDEDPKQSMARAEKAELKYPIIVVKRKNGKLWIADGTHRAHKAILNKLPSIDAKIIPIKDMSTFEISQELDENFADGQVKGKSRPGRVKRAGASCKGSVSDLRAKASKHGGERGRMYHWCANMKAGKK